MVKLTRILLVVQSSPNPQVFFLAISVKLAYVNAEINENIAKVVVLALNNVQQVVFL